MDEETVFAWEVAQMMGISNSKFLRTCADDLPCQKKGGVRLYLRSDVEGYLYGGVASIKPPKQEKDNGTGKRNIN